MSTPEEEGGTFWDFPNTQVVRADRSAPWDEGTGGEAGDPVTPPPEEETGPPGGSQPPVPPEAPTTAELDEMTKAELLAYAQQLGVSPANNDMTKDEIRAGIDAKLAEGGT